MGFVDMALLWLAGLVVAELSARVFRWARPAINPWHRPAVRPIPARYLSPPHVFEHWLFHGELVA